MVISLDGNYESPAEYSPRRYSIAIKHPGNYYQLIIGSLSYRTGFDSEDIDEPLNKFINGEFKILLHVPTTKTLEMQSLSEWEGSSQELRAMFDIDI